MKLAIIGTGIAGNVAAYHLHREHDITVFEANDYVGGHTHTHRIATEGREVSVDTGFIVFNHRTYPNFVKLLRELGVAEQKSDMSFSVKCERSGLEYNGTNLNSLFAQRRNLFSRRFHRMIRDILRFNREALELLETDAADCTLGEFLLRQRYGEAFVDHYIIPMGAAIWSTDPEMMFHFPARYFIRFFANHGMLSVNDRPQWYVVQGGSQRYVEPLIEPFKDRIRLGTPVERIERHPDHVRVTSARGQTQHFDAVFIASHSNQALRMLADPSQAERAVLGAIPYQANEAVLHTDMRLLPRQRRAWAAWNYHLLPQEQHRVALTYNMNILQSLDTRQTFCVTLNNSSAIDEAKVIKRLSYEHPLYTPEGVAAQQRQGDINGERRTYFCGAYWGFGFHEDGVVSALNAVQHFNQRVAQDEKLHLRRAS